MALDDGVHVGRIVGHDHFEITRDRDNTRRYEVMYTDGLRLRIDIGWPYRKILDQIAQQRGRKTAPPLEEEWRAFRGAIARLANWGAIEWSE